MLIEAPFFPDGSNSEMMLQPYGAQIVAMSPESARSEKGTGIVLNLHWESKSLLESSYTVILTAPSEERRCGVWVDREKWRSTVVSNAMSLASCFSY